MLLAPQLVLGFIEFHTEKLKKFHDKENVRPRHFMAVLSVVYAISSKSVRTYSKMCVNYFKL